MIVAFVEQGGEFAALYQVVDLVRFLVQAMKRVQGLGYGEEVEKRGVLKLDTNFFAERGTAGLALVKDLTIVRGNDVFDDLKCCCLARAIGAQ